MENLRQEACIIPLEATIPQEDPRLYAERNFTQELIDSNPKKPEDSTIDEILEANNISQILQSITTDDTVTETAETIASGKNKGQWPPN